MKNPVRALLIGLLAVVTLASACLPPPPWRVKERHERKEDRRAEKHERHEDKKDRRAERRDDRKERRQDHREKHH